MLLRRLTSFAVVVLAVAFSSTAFAAPTKAPSKPPAKVAKEKPSSARHPFKSKAKTAPAKTKAPKPAKAKPAKAGPHPSSGHGIEDTHSKPLTA